MVSRAKLYEQLERLEIELKQDLVPHLKVAASGQNEYIFCVSDFDKSMEDKNNNDALTERLIHIGRQIIALRNKLGESDDNSIAVKICQYCREWSARHHSNDVNAQVLANRFLQEIENA